MSNFYNSEFPNGKRPKQRTPVESEPQVPVEQAQLPQQISQAPGLDSLPAVPEDYELPIDTAQAAPAETTHPVQEPITETQITHYEQPVVDNLAVSENVQAKNFRQLREAKEKAERERDEAIRMIQQQYRPNPDKQSTEEEEFNYNINPDDLVEGKHIKPLLQEFKKLKQELYQQKQQVTTTDQRTKLRLDYQDFDKVVNEDSISLLQYKFPALYNTLNSSTGGVYDTGVSTYTMMKQLGIYKSPEDNYNADKARIQANAAKPKPLASLSPQKGDSPLSNANAFAQGLTPELSKNLWKEMQDIRRKS